MKESKGTHRFSVTLSFAPKRSSDRVTENRCVPFDSFTCIYPALLPQHRTLYAKVDSTPHIYIYIYIYIYQSRDDEKPLSSTITKKMILEKSKILW